MSWLTSIVSFFANLLALLRGRQQAQHDALEVRVGEQAQTVSDQAAALKAEQAMGQALADQPKDKQALDNKLTEGKF